MDLPEDSSAIDFAYAIHSDIGDHTSEAKINNKIAPIFSKLKMEILFKLLQKKLILQVNGLIIQKLLLQKTY